MSIDTKAMVELGHKFACDIMVGTKKELMSMFIIVRGEHTDVIGTPWSDDAEKKVMIINVALEIVEKGADAWSFLTESWFARRAPGEPLGPRPMDDPNRLEGVVCIASDGEKTELHTWETKRDAEGNCTELVQTEEGQPQSFRSWISTALNRAITLHRVLKQGGDVTEALEALRRV